ncbi:meiotically upregulated Mug22 [Schizosaccharomyces cryophilus OY26]|uniref:Meiotically upregulated Mug22 n=1 Tax=Schizosaccharomyces cryophilus (strain OY26 / ATCC MYA-4695 / CBS 11777 / NBRC 106824 / NRRL Y48691) TaxID=653667 RepID=S9VXT1_SCHCR|nr:meiotically upregulated Mug22 [Schizosaccharomyces cryophilus OY26]EPY50790.1 meiotically upregulated Mug22 [Schizosaccharomyces cryophilus OY26]
MVKSMPNILVDSIQEWESYMENLDDECATFGRVARMHPESNMEEPENFAKDAFHYFDEENEHLSRRKIILLRAKRRLCQQDLRWKHSKDSENQCLEKLTGVLKNHVERMLKFCRMICEKLSETFEIAMKVAKEFQDCKPSQAWFYVFQLKYLRKQKNHQILPFVSEWIIMIQQYIDLLNEFALVQQRVLKL